jgi:hypothetical protein
LDPERHDQKRRRKICRRTGTIPARICPTARTYQDYQIKNGVKGAEWGGLYTRIVIHDFLPEYPGRVSFCPGLSEYGGIKSWTGSPIASLHRAMLTLSNLSISGISPGIQEVLLKLQDLYREGSNISQDDSLDISDESDIEVTEECLSEPLQANKASERLENLDGLETVLGKRICREKEEIGDMMSTVEVKGEGHGKVSIQLKNENGAGEFCNFIDSSRFWKWGPGATSEDAATFFRSVV